jgi:class 3 adenylate cyclase
MSDLEQLQKAITALEAQRATLGNEVVDAALASMHEKLARLKEQQPSSGPQLKYVTVLFTDIVGSTHLAQRLDPEEIMGIMDTALRRFDAIVEQHGGRVLRFMGDGLKAVFGAPAAQEDDAERAVRAGLALLQDAQVYAREVLARTGLEGFNIRVGINTGQVVLGGGVEADNTAMGMTINLAARMESTAPPGSLRISYETYRHIRGIFDVQSQAPLVVKGQDEPIQTYLVLRAKPRAFRTTTRGVEGVETRMVGRQAELKELQSSFETAIRASETRLITIVGDPGVGESCGGAAISAACCSNSSSGSTCDRSVCACSEAGRASPCRLLPTACCATCSPSASIF